MRTLVQCLEQPGIIKVPGIFDGLSCHLVTKAGFDAAFVSGAGLAFSRFGVPDIGLLGIHDIADTIRAIREYNDLPLIVDIDTGFGNALNTQRTTKLLERAGANAMQLEDQLMPKRCGHMAGKQVIPCAEMVGKIHAFVDARRSADTLLIARTDALGVEGFDEALYRAEQYLLAGADLLFIEAPTTREQMQAISAEFGERVPLVHNLVEGGNSPISTSYDLAILNYKLALYPIALLNAFIPKAQHLLQHIQASGSTVDYQEELWQLQQVNDLLNVSDMLAVGDQYQP
ncbi:oxaloacetate decarboxylase [Thalassotalea maritima]|uniref:isocitrate lyase/PEP mutase family protein n=1 Tax=Thalassotalea maritima TaxID=3242416 RepID=UPI003529689B